MPAQDQALLAWAVHLHSVANTNAAALGLSGTTLTDLMAFITNFDVALQDHLFTQSEAKAKTAAKKAASNAMTEFIRQVVRAINGHPGVSDALKIELGIKHPPEPMPEQPEPPIDLVAKLDGFGTVRLSWKRGANRSGTTFWVESRDYDSAEWTFVSSTLATRFQVVGLEPGRATAYRVVARRANQTSVPSNPVFVYAQAPEEEPVQLQVAA